MVGDHEERRMQADFFSAPANDQFARLPSYERLLIMAKKGARDGASLDEEEVRHVCHALLVHFAQMGIG